LRLFRISDFVLRI